MLIVKSLTEHHFLLADENPFLDFFFKFRDQKCCFIKQILVMSWMNRDET